MRAGFEGYFKPAVADLAKFLRDAVIAPDANVLLQVHRCDPAVSEEIFAVLTDFKKESRLFLPHQVAREYHANRAEVLLEQVKAYADADDLLEKAALALSRLEARHSSADFIKVCKATGATLTAAKAELGGQKSKHPGLTAEDPLRDSWVDIFGDCTGTAFSDEELAKFYKDGEKRFAQKVPPGYADEKKPSPAKYGDYLVWEQLILFATNAKKPVLFITEDRKPDWWYVLQNKTLGPRPELIHEFMARAQQPFYMYTLDEFVKHARKHFKRPPSSSSSELAKMREERERVARAELQSQDILNNALATPVWPGGITNLSPLQVTNPFLQAGHVKLEELTKFASKSNINWLPTLPSNLLPTVPANLMPTYPSNWPFFADPYAAPSSLVKLASAYYNKYPELLKPEEPAVAPMAPAKKKGVKKSK